MTFTVLKIQTHQLQQLHWSALHKDVCHDTFDRRLNQRTRLETDAVERFQPMTLGRCQPSILRRQISRCRVDKPPALHSTTNPVPVSLL